MVKKKLKFQSTSFFNFKGGTTPFQLQRGEYMEIIFSKGGLFSASKYMEMSKFEKLSKWKIIISKGDHMEMENRNFKGGTTWTFFSFKEGSTQSYP